MLEDLVEQSHQVMRRIHVRIAGLGTCEKRAISLSKNLERANDAEVQEIQSKVAKATKRRRVSTQPVETKEEKSRKRRATRQEAMEKINPEPEGEKICELKIAASRNN